MASKKAPAKKAPAKKAPAKKSTADSTASSKSEVTASSNVAGDWLTSLWFRVPVTLLVLALLGWGMQLDESKSSSKSDSGNDRAESAEVVSKDTVMPSVVGMTYEFATERLDAGGFKSYDYIDLLGSRSVWDNTNWIVRQQSPAPGTEVTSNDRICLGVVKLDEDWRENVNLLKCWQSAADEIEGLTFSLKSSDIIDVTLTNRSMAPAQYRMWLKVELDSSIGEIEIGFCTNTVVQPGQQTTYMELTPLNGLQVYDNDTFRRYGGQFRYEIKKLEKNLGGTSCGTY